MFVYDDSVRAALTIIGLVASERIGELFLARRNQRRLIAAGGREVGASHYPLIVAVHAGWLVAMAVYVVAVRPGVHPVPLIAFIAVQPLRLWVIATLGRFWTTRIITLPGAPLVRRGPYRFIRHPNYAIVVAEIALLPLAFGAWSLAAIFSLLNAGVLTLRTRAENAALAERQGLAANTRRAIS